MQLIGIPSAERSSDQIELAIAIIIGTVIKNMEKTYWSENSSNISLSILQCTKE
jgi:hypothetical protein